MDKFDKRTMVDDFIDEQGIVVEFPGDIDDELVALVKFAQTCLEDAEQAEDANARLRAALLAAMNFMCHVPHGQTLTDGETVELETAVRLASEALAGAP